MTTSSSSEADPDENDTTLDVDIVDTDMPNWKTMDDIPKSNTTLESITSEIRRMLNDIGYAQTKDPELVDIRQRVEKQQEEGKENKRYVVMDDKLYHVGNPTVKDPEVRLQLAVPRQMIGLLLDAYHRPYHLGIDRTYALMHQRVHWETMYHDIVLHCTRCVQCQRANLRMKRAPLQQRQLPAYPMQKVAMDTIGPLPESEEGYCYIVTLVCMFSGYVEAWPTKDKSAQSVARILLNDFIPRHSVPMTLMTDCGGEFMAEIIDIIAANLGIHKISVTPYSPWSNGHIERCNGTIKRALLKRVGGAHYDWPDHLPSVLMAMRVAVQESSRFSPFFVLYGRDPTLPMDTLLRPKLKYTGEDWTTIQLGRMHDAFMLIKANTQVARDRQKKLYDRKSEPVNLKVGDAVWYYYPVVEKGVPAKLQQKWLPQYRIVKFKSPVTAVIRHQPTGETRAVHVNHLRPAKVDESWDKNYDAPEPVANRRIENTKRAAYERNEQQKKTRKEKIRNPTVGERQQPMRACRTRVPSSIPLYVPAHAQQKRTNEDDGSQEMPAPKKKVVRPTFLPGLKTVQEKSADEEVEPKDEPEEMEVKPETLKRHREHHAEEQEIEGAVGGAPEEKRMLTRGQKRLVEDDQIPVRMYSYVPKLLTPKRTRSQGEKRSSEESTASTSSESKKTRVQGEKRPQDDGPYFFIQEGMDPKRRRPMDPEQQTMEPVKEEAEEMDVEEKEDDIYYDAKDD